MPINASYEFFNAEKDYINAKTLEEKIYFLEEMIRKAPSHKGAENLRAELKTRLKKLIEKQEKNKKIGVGKKGLKKEGFQFVIVGPANCGKSSLLSKLTNAQPFVSDFPFSTKNAELGTFDFEGVRAQVVDLPSIGSEYFDVGVANTADCLLIVLEKMDDLIEVEKKLTRARGKKIIVVNKVELFNSDERRKLEARMKSKKINGVLVSSLTGEGIQELKIKMFAEMDVVRVYMKEPGKPKTNIPAVLKNGATVKDVAENIYKGFSAKVKEARLTGPSSKFPNQKVGLSHVVADLDVIEFHMR